jgi:hypothetical protein
MGSALAECITPAAWLSVQDGTVGLNREKMRLREERLVQLRSRKKGGVFLS